ncbi:unnamed protein product [Eruca vesicaria subsp. sativa]|uniref:Protein kinase domain-containing protein n=1 Tax=Eruca vesicaria subsp. sativa TaxID=29727 RepID=A0ABC8LKF0_ERUVS|nr:unnamed protein product [Eruca vesicaria subsp. sativa]
MMSCKNKNYSLFLILFKLLLLMILWCAASSSCPSECGGVSIPYPFGIGNNCYLEKSYEIECRSTTTTSRKLVPFLSVINKEVVSISLPNVGDRDSLVTFGIVRIRSPITYTGCFTSTDGKATRAPIMNLTGSPMFIDYMNILIAVGCNSKVSFTHVEPNIVGCELNCRMIKESHNILNVPGCSSNVSYSYISSYVCTDDEHTTCSGNGCCQASLPSIPQQVLGIRIESNDGNSTRTKQEHCTVAFLTDEVFHFSNGTNPQKLLAKGHSTVSLAWIIQTKNTSYLNSLACKNGGLNSTSIVDHRTKCTCEILSNSSEISYASCVCNQGYSGNPYIVDRCVDIDECKRGIYSCEEGQNCVNTLGHYKCVGDKTKSILIGVGSGFGVLALVGGVWWLRKFLIKRRIEKRKQKFFKRNGGLLLQQELNTSDGNVEKTRIFSSRELEKATENFSKNRVIGQGGQGTVYKGMLLDGRTVAVKKSKVIDEDKLQEFINEVVILSQINHRHVVKLLGCCLETEVPILIYEFILNGNLFQHIHEDSDDYTMIWGMRLSMAVDVAGALSYLHSSASSAIYHRDIKSTNILLDEKHRAKVADFGTSRSITIDQTHWTTVVSGTVGYVDPEYYRSSQFTDKSDVYSFGVVLAELITGEKPVIMVGNTRGTVSLADHFRLAIKEKRLDDIVDARIKEDCKLEQVMAVANLAMKCLSSKGNKRPNMREVFTELERICTSPEDSQVQQIQVDEEEKEEVRNMINKGDSMRVGVTAPAFSVAASPSSSNAEPLFHRRPTW